MNAIGKDGVTIAQAGPSRLGAALGVAFALTLALASATQFFAWQMQFQAALGWNLAGFYPPWAILPWALRWYTKAPEAFMQAEAVGAAVAAIGMGAVFVARILRLNSPLARFDLHGTARWATLDDIGQAGLLNNDGVYVGQFVEPGPWWRPWPRVHYLRHNGPENILSYAPPRSGKGVGLVIPSLLSWASSVVVNDMKGELWALTSGWRQSFARNKVLRFEPASATHSIAFNPLDGVRVGTDHEVGDAQNLATMLVDPDGKGLHDHWQKSARAVLTGCILHVLYCRQKDGTLATLEAVDALMANPEQPISELWNDLLAYRYSDGQPNPVVARYARDMVDTPTREAGSKVSTVKTSLELWRDPVIAKNTNHSDFRLADLMHHEHPVTLYIITQPADKDRLKPLVRIMINLIVRNLAYGLEFTEGRSVPHYQHRLLLMLDEFVSSLGKLEIMQQSLAFLSGYGIKAYLVCQDINQLKSTESGYGPDEAITSSCHIQSAYPPNRVETAEYMSKMTGQTTVVKPVVSVSGGRLGFLGHVTRSFHEYQRPLLTVDEVMRMRGPRKDSQGDIVEPGDMLIFVNNTPAIYGRQPLYFKDPVFLARAKVSAPTVSDRLL
jgi:type IV secretion system protein VirD4